MGVASAASKREAYTGGAAAGGMAAASVALARMTGRQLRHTLARSSTAIRDRVRARGCVRALALGPHSICRGWPMGVRPGAPSVLVALQLWDRPRHQRLAHAAQAVDRVSYTHPYVYALAMHAHSGALTSYTPCLHRPR